MSDYISKSALLKNLWDWRLQECPVGVCDEETETYKTICECIKAVEEQPTVDEKEIIRKAFERVVERLEESKDAKCFLASMPEQRLRGSDDAYDDAIKSSKGKKECIAEKECKTEPTGQEIGSFCYEQGATFCSVVENYRLREFTFDDLIE